MGGPPMPHRNEEPMPDKVRVGLVGSQFISTIHAESLQRCADAQIVAAASPTESHLRTFAERFSIPRWFTDWRQMLTLDELDLIVIGAPNDLHHDIAIAAAQSGKHVVCEKPLCMKLAEADRMIDACKKA